MLSHLSQVRGFTGDLRMAFFENLLMSCMISDRSGPCQRLLTPAAPKGIEDLVIYRYIGTLQPANEYSPRL
jgi:hypothetical protein